MAKYIEAFDSIDPNKEYEDDELPIPKSAIPGDVIMYSEDRDMMTYFFRLEI